LADPGREDRADVGREPAVSERVRAEAGRAEDGLCLKAVLVTSGSDEIRAFADVGRRGPGVAALGLCGPADEALITVYGMVTSADSLKSGLATLCTSFDDQSGLNS